MNISQRLAGKAFAVSALTLAMSGALYADDPVVLTLGETINVTGTADTAPAACTGTGTVTCATLREAVIHANDNGNGATNFDVINLPAGTISLSIAGANEDAAANGDLDLTEAVNIVGAGVASTIVDGGGSGGALQERVFTVHGVQVGISDLTLTNGFAKHELGGAIFNDEKSILTLTNCAVTNSTATWDGDYTTDTMDVDKNPIPDGTPGTAENPEGTTESQGHGGAIYSKDVMTIENCVFRGNIAENIVDSGVPDPDPHHTGNILVKVGNGGAINSSQYTVINNSTFGSNIAIDANSNTAINGGGVFLTGGNPIEITNSTFSFNSAISGGGICNVSPSAPTSITNSTISGNHVTDSGAGIETNAAMNLLNVTIANNVKDSSTKGSGLNTGPSVAIYAQNVLFDNNLADELAISANCGAKGGSFVLADSNGGNISSDGTCDLQVGSGDQEDVSTAAIALQALADNNADLSGTTFTHALPLSSAAVDAGANTDCPTNDQRGSIRPFNATLIPTSNCDSGAYELYVERTDLHIENVTAPQEAILDTNVNIVVVVDNGSAGASNPANDVELVVTLPSQMTFVSASGCTNASGVVTCTIGTMAAGEEVTRTVVAKATTVGDDVIVNSTISTSSNDPIALNNSHNVFIDILESADLSITGATVDPLNVPVGSNATVTVNLSNLGPNTAKGIELSGVLPSIVSFVQGVGCIESNGTLTCAVDDLVADGTASVIFEVKAESEGSAEVTASATMDQVDTDPSDNSKTVIITVSPLADDVDGDGDVDSDDVVTPATGGGGGLCSYNPGARFDPVLPALILGAMAYLGFRRKQKCESKIK